MEISVAFLSPVSFFKGGAERSLFDLMENPSIRPVLIVTDEGPLSEEAARRGIEVCVIPFGSVSAIRRPLKVGQVVRAIRDWRRAAKRLAEVCRANGLAIVHSNGLKAHAVAILASAMGGVPSVSHVRDIAHTKLERKIWRLLAHFSAHTILVSRACWPDQKLPRDVSVIFNSMHQDSLELAPPERVAKETVIGVCGRIHPYKGIHLAVDWAAAARDKGLDIRIVIRGAAAPEDMDYLRQLESQVVELGIQNRVVFEGQKGRLHEIYGGLDAVLVPSNTPDPLPRSVMEALALGVPVIGYPAGGIVEMIEPGNNGWLADSSEAFCEAIVDITSMEEKRLTALKLRAKNDIRERFSRPGMFAEIDSVYDRVLRTPSIRS